MSVIIFSNEGILYLYNLRYVDNKKSMPTCCIHYCTYIRYDTKFGDYLRNCLKNSLSLSKLPRPILNEGFFFIISGYGFTLFSKG